MTRMRDTARLAPLGAGARPGRPDDIPEGCAEVYVYPGQLFATTDTVLATTILGTCVAVCLFDRERGVGGMNHFMLPGAPPDGALPDRFGETATTRLVDRLAGLGSAPRWLRAKVFGGMAGRAGADRIAHDLGARNVAVALERLRAHGIPVVSRDVGGPRSRKLLFHPSDGRAWVRHF